MDIMQILKVFRENGVHEAAVLDEYGNFSGIVTLHDILEELVGIMPSGEEEKKEEANRIIRRNDTQWLVEGLLPIEDFKDYFEVDDELPGEEDDLYKTLAGFVTYEIGRIPMKQIRVPGRNLLLKSSIWITFASTSFSSREHQLNQIQKKKRRNMHIQKRPL